jgi:hypothetical protein
MTTCYLPCAIDLRVNMLFVRCCRSLRDLTSTYPAAAPICLYRLCFDALANKQTDTKRARLRSVSTNADDKLVSCLELSYHNIHIRMRPPTSEDDAQVSTNYNDLTASSS